MDYSEREIAKLQAQKDLDNAVEQYIRAHEWGQGMILTGWVLVGHQSGYEDGEEKQAYPMIYMNGSLDDHVALGLLAVGRDSVRGIGYVREEESDEDD